MILEDLSFSSLKKISKQEIPEAKGKIRLALLGDFATQLFKVALLGAGKAYGLDFEIYESDYDQIDFEILNLQSQLYSFNPDWIILFQNNVSLKQKFYAAEDKSSFAQLYIDKLNVYYNHTQSKLNSKFVINNFSKDVDEVYGSYAMKVDVSFNYQLNLIEQGIQNFLEKSSNAFMIDTAARVNEVGIANAYDYRMAVNASMPFQLDFLAKMALDSAKIVSNHEGRIAKCLILDLDNTIWGGIIGDDGMEGIEIGELGIGKAFKHLQYWAKSLKERGIILAVCSKNEETVAKEPFGSHPEMVLKLEDISIFVANWESKAENIKYIQKVLNIGFDSMVFVDDNPMERDIVRKMIPNVIVPEMPKDPVDYMPYLRSLDLFSTVNYSIGDKDRTKQYQEEAKRIQVQSSFNSIEEYLKSLDMEAELGSFNDFYVPRIAQLTQRSNQFNPRTQRYSEEEIRKIISSDHYYSLYVVLKDKFGDYGLISNLILKKETDSLFIENWVMSCRVLKRQVEELVINSVIDIARRNSIKKIQAEYIPSAKNSLVKELFTKLNFERITDNKYELLVAEYKNKSHQIKIL